MFSTYRKVLVIAGLVFCSLSSVFAYSGGSGEPNDPYRIATVSDWNDLMNTSSDCNKCFIMTADVNLQGVPLTPVGNDVNQFTGVFDGNDNIISNAVINQPSSDYIGLFGYVGSGGQIRNLGVENVNITGRNVVGGLVGEIDADSLTNCYATGLVTGTGTVNTCVGGLVGVNWSGTLNACYATGSVSGGNYSVGGLVGYNYAGTLNACYATGSVSGDNYCVGGLVGINWSGTLNACYATGSVSGVKTVGGLVGSNSGTLTSCYATGSVSGVFDNVGGLVGGNSDSISNCYATGTVSGSEYVGGLVGHRDAGSVSSSFWDTQTSGQTTSAGGTGKTTVEMKMLATFTSANWDFVDTWNIGESQTYPFLRKYFIGDLNLDKRVDFIDFALFADDWLEGIN